MQFNKSYHDITNAASRFVVVYGGAGSGKSYSVHQNELTRLKTARHNTLVIRKHASDLYDSCYALFRNIADAAGTIDDFTWHYSNMKRQIIHKQSGAKIILRGLDDPEKLKSIVGINRIMIEEASQLDFADFRELNRRARGAEDIQITMVLNPVDERHWIKKHFVDKDGAYNAETTSLKYLYTDNMFLTPEDIAELERLKFVDLNEYNIYVKAMWGVRDNKRAWLYNFDAEKHLGRAGVAAFKPSFPVYLSFDFNNEPFACTAWQMSASMGAEHSFLHCIREFSGCWKIEEMCERIITAFPASILYVTGDRSGQNEDIGRNQTLYQMIQSYLGLSAKQMNLNTHNLEHADSRLLCNALFGTMPGLNINGDACPNLAAQCRNARVDERSSKPGTLLKDRADHKNDELDSMRYLFQTYFLDYAKQNYYRPVKRAA